MEAQKFLELIEKIRSNTYVDSELDLGVDEFFEEKFIDRLDDVQAVELAEALKHNTHITKVDLYGNEIGDIGATALASVNTIKELRLVRNQVTSEGLAALGKSNLKSLVVSTSLLEDNLLCEVAVINSFVTNKTLESLDLEGCYFHEYFLNRFVSELITNNVTIKTLILPRDGHIEDEALKFIGNNRTLKELYIGESNLTDKGASYIACNTSIESLTIRASYIRDDGASFLTLSPALKKLEIYSSDITAAGAKVFIHSNLREFTIKGKQEILSYEDARYINLAFRDVRNENGEVVPIKKAKLEHQDTHIPYHTEGASLLGEAQGSYELDSWTSDEGANL